MSATTKTTTAGLAALWAAIVAIDLGAWPLHIPLPLHSTLLAALITLSLLNGYVLITRGPAMYRAMQLGRTVERHKERARVQANGKPHRHLGEITTGEIRIG